MLTVQHFFVTQRRHTVEEATRNVGAVVKEVRWGRVFVPKVFGDQGALLPS